MLGKVPGGCDAARSYLVPPGPTTSCQLLRFLSGAALRAWQPQDMLDSTHLLSAGFKDHGALAAAILVPLLLLLLCIACCCCGASPADARDRYFFIFCNLRCNPPSLTSLHTYSPLCRAAVPDDGVVPRMKHHVLGVLANLSAMMPCFSLGGYKLPKVTGEKAEQLRPLPACYPHPVLSVLLLSGGSLHPPPCPTAWLRAGVALLPQSTPGCPSSAGCLFLPSFPP